MDLFLVIQNFTGKVLDIQKNDYFIVILQENYPGKNWIILLS